MIILHSSRATGDWQRAADLHRLVADSIRAGAKAEAVAAIRRHLDEAFSSILKA